MLDRYPSWQNLHQDATRTAPILIPVDCFQETPSHMSGSDAALERNSSKRNTREVGPQLSGSFYVLCSPVLCSSSTSCIQFSSGGESLGVFVNTRLSQTGLISTSAPIVDSTLSSYDSSSFQRYSQRLDNLESQMDQRLNDIVSHVGLDSPKLDHDLSQRAFGARIVTGLTSPTSLQAVAPTSFFSSILPFGSGSEVKTKANVHLPSVVLERSLLLGDCWLFDGGAGHITIQLPYPANLTAITIDYLPLSQLGPTFHLYAPRSVTVWGLVRLSKHLTLSSLPVGQLHRPASHFSRHKRLPSRVIKPNDIFVPLVTLEYDIHSGGREIAYISDLEIGSSYDIVVVEVTENWGGDSTCLYHIGVHGQVESVIART